MEQKPGPDPVPPKTPPSTSDLRDRALKGGAAYLAARICLQSFQWIITLVVARYLLPEDYGWMAVSSLITELAGFWRPLESAMRSCAI